MKKLSELVSGNEFSNPMIPIHLADVGAVILDSEHFIVEANVLSLPIFSYATGKSAASAEGMYTHKFTQLINGEPVNCSISVPKVHTKSDPSGRFLNGFDQDVLIALMDLWQDQGKSKSGVVKFKASDITKKLRLSSDGGRVYEQIRSSIQLLSSTNITHNNAFRVGKLIISKELPIKFITDYKIEEVETHNYLRYLLFEVTLSKTIVENLLSNFSGKIRRDEYLSLRSPLAKRIFQYIEFNNKKSQEVTNRYTYELTDLSTRLAMRGATTLSIIKQRLGRALNELKVKNLFDHAIHTIDRKHFITFIDLSNYPYLVGLDKLEDYLKLIKKVYDFNLSEKFSYTTLDFEQMFKKYDRVIEIGNRKYSWVYHVISVVLYQIFELKMDFPKKPFAYIEGLLKKPEVDIPRGYKPLDILFETVTTRKLSEEKAVTVAKDREKNAIIFKTFAENYFDQFPEDLRKEYIKKVHDTFDVNVFPNMKESFIRSRAIDIFADDIANGKLKSL